MSSAEREGRHVGIERVDGRGRVPELEAVRGPRVERESPAEPSDALDLGGDAAHDEIVVRPAKVAEARLKILNDYYSRRDIQLALAERLMLELGE
jgi:hypothetical protein